MDSVILVRHSRLSRSVKRLVLGPCQGGRHWALEGANDLPWWGCDHGSPYDKSTERRCSGKHPDAHKQRVRLDRLLQAGCQVWVCLVGAAGQLTPWRQIQGGADIPADWLLRAGPEAWARYWGEEEVPSPPALDFYVRGCRGGTASLRKQ